jgi:hypothetical protein
MAVELAYSWHRGDRDVEDLRVWVTARGRRLEMRVHGALDARGSRHLAEIVGVAIRVAKEPRLVELDVRPVSAYCQESSDALLGWERQGIRVRRRR